MFGKCPFKKTSVRIIDKNIIILESITIATINMEMNWHIVTKKFRSFCLLHWLLLKSSSINWKYERESDLIRPHRSYYRIVPFAKREKSLINCVAIETNELSISHQRQKTANVQLWWTEFQNLSVQQYS